MKINFAATWLFVVLSPLALPLQGAPIVSPPASTVGTAIEEAAINAARTSVATSLRETAQTMPKGITPPFKNLLNTISPKVSSPKSSVPEKPSNPKSFLVSYLWFQGKIEQCRDY